MGDAQLKQEHRTLTERVADFVNTQRQNGEASAQAVIGRQAAAVDIKVRGGEKSVSRQHCRIELDGGSWYLVNLSKQLGTRVNAHHLAGDGHPERHELHAGDVIQLLKDRDPDGHFWFTWPPDLPVRPQEDGGEAARAEARPPEQLTASAGAPAADGVERTAGTSASAEPRVGDARDASQPTAAPTAACAAASRPVATPEPARTAAPPAATPRTAEPLVQQPLHPAAAPPVSMAAGCTAPQPAAASGAHSRAEDGCVAADAATASARVNAVASPAPQPPRPAPDVPASAPPGQAAAVRSPAPDQSQPAAPPAPPPAAGGALPASALSFSAVQRGARALKAELQQLKTATRATLEAFWSEFQPELTYIIPCAVAAIDAAVLAFQKEFTDGGSEGGSPRAVADVPAGTPHAAPPAPVAAAAAATPPATPAQPAPSALGSVHAAAPTPEGAAATARATEPTDAAATEGGGSAAKRTHAQLVEDANVDSGVSNDTGAGAAAAAPPVVDGGDSLEAHHVAKLAKRTHDDARGSRSAGGGALVVHTGAPPSHGAEAPIAREHPAPRSESNSGMLEWTASPEPLRRPAGRHALEQLDRQPAEQERFELVPPPEPPTAVKKLVQRKLINSFPGFGWFEGRVLSAVHQGGEYGQPQSWKFFVLYSDGDRRYHKYEQVCKGIAKFESERRHR